MSITAIAATYAYRHMVAQAAASGGELSPISFLAFGDWSNIYDMEQTALQSEFVRVPASLSVSGVTATARATITHSHVGGNVLREIGAFTASGVLVGRRVVAPKEFDGDTEMDFEVSFQF